MERNILKKRIKGLLAFMLVVMMMFGSSLTVLAAYWSGGQLQVGTVVNGGDVISVSGGYVECGSENFGTGSVTLPAEGKWQVIDKRGDDNAWFVQLQLVSSAGGTGTAEPEPSGSSCQHEYEWVIGIMPTEEKDGRFDYECKHCGSVTAHQPLSFLYVIICNIIADIKEAPVNGVVTVDSKYLRSLPDEIIDALLARPDVTLDVKFADKGVPLHFTIPAGMAPTDDADWYGYYYLGTAYGWIW